MVAAFLQLHHDVDESSDATFDPLTEGCVVPCQYPPVTQSNTQTYDCDDDNNTRSQSTTRFQYLQALAHFLHGYDDITSQSI